jgi:4-hydroxybenzoate polyprenyltransferase
LFELLSAIGHGRATIKEFFAKGFEFDSSDLPFRKEVLSLIESRRLAGDPIILATAASGTIALKISSETGFFDSSLSSDSRINLSGKKKADALVKLYGHKGFDYVGDSSKDLPVWQASRNSYLVGRSFWAKRAFLGVDAGEHLQGSRDVPILNKWIRAFRIHQWVKNSLVFVPAIAAQRIFEAEVPLKLLVAFLVFGILASAVYIINDIVDIQNDRSHVTKKLRPIANGEISIPTAITVALALICGAGLLSTSLPGAFSLALLVYFVVTSSYSLWLKRILVVDVVALSALYSLRLLAGGLAVSITVSSWLLAVSFFLFLSLSLVKRSSELTQSSKSGVLSPGRAYLIQDLPIVNALGVASGLMSTVVFSLYLDSQTAYKLYESSFVLWGALPVLVFWVSWIWIQAGRGRVNEDPIAFALRDRGSLISGALIFLIFLVAQSGML